VDKPTRSGDFPEMRAVLYFYSLRNFYFLFTKRCIMATAGYSGKPLISKLGIRHGMKVKLIHSPDNYMTLLEQDIRSQLVGNEDVPDLVHLFVDSSAKFQMEMKLLKPYFKLKPDLVIWVSWYKKSSGIITDIGEDDIRSYALQNDLVDIKVCAVDEIWSGLKLVIPVSKRKYPPVQ